MVLGDAPECSRVIVVIGIPVKGIHIVPGILDVYLMIYPLRFGATVNLRPQVKRK